MESISRVMCYPHQDGGNQKLQGRGYIMIAGHRRRYNRSQIACTFCRKRKIRCDGQTKRQCSNCQKGQQDCMYIPVTIERQSCVPVRKFSVQAVSHDNKYQMSHLTRHFTYSESPAELCSVQGPNVTVQPLPGSSYQSSTIQSMNLSVQDSKTSNEGQQSTYPRTSSAWMASPQWSTRGIDRDMLKRLGQNGL